MDRVLGLNAKSRRQQHFKKGKKDIKVVYISTPMKVKTSASKFRAIVQELTGKDSDTTRLNVDANYNYVPENPTLLLDDGFDNHHRDQIQTVPDMNLFVSSHGQAESSDLSPDSSGLVEPFDEVPGLPEVDDSFMGWFESSFLFHESALTSQLGVIN